MDEFRDLDSEIERLKAELSAQDDLVRQVQTPSSDNYWRNRVDEERVLWKKRIDLKDEERRALESKMHEQEQKIGSYNDSLRELEKKLEYESKQWEERLRIKEADLLIEKNRLLNEEKVKEADFENRQLLAKLAGLNEKMNELRDEHITQVGKLKEIEEKERAAYEGKSAAHLREIELLQKRAGELEGALAERTAALERATREYSLKLASADQRIVSLTGDAARLAGEAAAAKKRGEEEQRTTENAYKTMNRAFARNLLSCLGKVTGLIGFMSRYPTGKYSWKLLWELLQKTEQETDYFLLQTDPSFSSYETLRLTVCLAEDDQIIWDQVLAGIAKEEQNITPRDIRRDVASFKPQAVLISGKYLRAARRLHSRFPFLPVIVTGAFKPSKAKKLLADGFSVLAYPGTTKEMENILLQAARNSVAGPDHWGKVKIRRSYLAPLAVAAALVLGVVAGYQAPQLPLPQGLLPIRAISMPYMQPTNITFDGQDLWTCDWFGQSVYRHSGQGDMPLQRIFNFPGKHFTALSWAGGYLWSADPWENKIYKHNADEKLAILASYSYPFQASITGLTGDGKYLWSCDAAKGAIYKHKIEENLTVAELYPSPGPSPSGLFHDGTFLWSVDAKTNKIYQHALDKNLTVVATYIPPNYEEKGFSLSGIVYHDGYFWVCSEKTGKVFRYSRNMLKKVRA